MPPIFNCSFNGGGTLLGEDAVTKIIVSYNIKGKEEEILYSFRNLLMFANITNPEGVIEKE